MEETNIPSNKKTFHIAIILVVVIVLNFFSLVFGLIDAAFVASINRINLAYLNTTFEKNFKMFILCS